MLVVPPLILTCRRVRHGQGALSTSLLPFLAALLALLLVLAVPVRAAESDKGVVADLISRALSSPSMSVSVGAVDGVLSSDSTISDIVLSDRDGPWLKIDKVRLSGAALRSSAGGSRSIG